MRLPVLSLRLVLVLLAGFVSNLHVATGQCDSRNTLSVMPARFPTPAADGLAGMSSTWGGCSSSLEKSESCLFIFGGLNAQLNLSNELWYISLEEPLWAQISPLGTDLPPARLGGELQFWNKTTTSKLVLFGGLGEDPSDPTKKLTVLDDLWMFDFEHREWRNVKTTGNGPSARFLHAMELFGDELLVLGGMTLRDLSQPIVSAHWTPVDDTSVYIINLNELGWNSTSSAPRALSPRGGSAFAALLSNKTFFIMGGALSDDYNSIYATNEIWVFSLEQREWKQIVSLPLPLAFARGGCMDDFGQDQNSKVQVFFLGGTQYPSNALVKGEEGPISNPAKYVY